VILSLEHLLYSQLHAVYKLLRITFMLTLKLMMKTLNPIASCGIILNLCPMDRQWHNQQDPFGIVVPAIKNSCNLLPDTRHVFPYETQFFKLSNCYWHPNLLYYFYHLTNYIIKSNILSKCAFSVIPPYSLGRYFLS
jgi:hypothetical protein